MTKLNFNKITRIQVKKTIHIVADRIWFEFMRERERERERKRERERMYWDICYSCKFIKKNNIYLFIYLFRLFAN